MRLSDYLINYLYDNGVKVVFMGAGGGMMYLSDAVKKHGKMKFVCFHHEQAAAYAAVGYAKLTNTPGVCIVTSGCGGMNVMTPLLVAYQDYTPLIVIQGQTDEKYIDYTKRKFGVQGMDTEAVVATLSDFFPIRNEFDIQPAFEAVKDCPVWMEIPIFTQCKEV